MRVYDRVLLGQFRFGSFPFILKDRQLQGDTGGGGAQEGNRCPTQTEKPSISSCWEKDKDFPQPGRGQRENEREMGTYNWWKVGHWRGGEDATRLLFSLPSHVLFCTKAQPFEAGQGESTAM